jgi:hypothetical protein
MGIIVDGQADLPKVIGAGTATRGFAGGLHSRQEEADQDPDDGDDNQKLHERKCMAGTEVHGGFLQTQGSKSRIHSTN